MIKNRLDSIMPQSPKLSGFYIGVVEDVNDPVKMGRIKARIFGLHTEKVEENSIAGSSTDNLMWVYPMAPLTGGASGFGLFSIPLKGSHVAIMFRDGNVMEPYYFASLPGMSTEESSPDKGFNDPSGTFPRTDRINEPDFHRLMRGEKLDQTVIQHRKNVAVNDIPSTPKIFTDDSNSRTESSTEESTEDPKWSELEPKYEAEYSKNLVFTTHSGITIELDSTDYKQRIHIYHPSNTYIEVDKEGNVAIRTTKDRYEIIDRDSKIYVARDSDETVAQDKTEFTKGNQFEKIGKSKKTTILQKLQTEIAGHEERTVEAGRETDINGEEVLRVNGNMRLVVTGQLDIVTGGLSITSIGGTGTTGQIDLQGAGDMTMQVNNIQGIANDITLNTGTTAINGAVSIPNLVTDSQP